MIIQVAMVFSFSQLAVVPVARLDRACSSEIFDELCKYKPFGLWHLFQCLFAFFARIETVYFMVYSKQNWLLYQK